MKPECDEIRPLLGAYADKELDAAQSAKVGQHLAACPDCVRELAQIEQLHNLVKSVEHPELADDYWHWHRARVWRGIRGPTRKRMPSFRPSFVWTRFATVAAGLAVVLVVVISGWRMFGERQLLTGKGAVAVAAPIGSYEEAVPRAVENETKVAAAADKVEEARTESGKSGEMAAAGGVAKSVIGSGADKDGLNAATGGAREEGWGAAKPKASVARERSAQEMNRSLAAPPAPAERADAMAKKADSGEELPVLLESPPMPDLDILDTGTVLLDVMTDSNGLVLNAVVSQSSGSVLLDSIALLQMRQSRFSAMVKNNRQVPGFFEYPYRFLRAGQTEDK